MFIENQKTTITIWYPHPTLDIYIFIIYRFLHAF